MIIAYFQATVKAELVLKAFLGMLKVNGKNKFEHFLYDLGLRYALAAAVFAVGLVFSVAVPLVCPVVALLFGILYTLDKYNLVFVYPLDFDSQIANRKALILHSLAAVLLFQILMLGLLYPNLHAGTEYYAIAALVMQLVMIAVTLEFGRKPWKGKLQQVEAAEEVEKDRFFEEISSFHGEFTHDDLVQQDGEREDLLTAEMKQRTLKAAYQDPFDELFRIMEAKEEGDNGRGENYEQP